MCRSEDNKALSKVELILPANVVEACWNLKKHNQAFFFAVNEHDKTSSEINIHKLGDSSVKIRVTVFPLNHDRQDEQDEDEMEAGPSSQDSSVYMEESEIQSPSPIRGSPRRVRRPVEVETPRLTPKKGKTGQMAAASAPQRKYPLRGKEVAMEEDEKSEDEETSPNIAAAVKKMKSVLSPQKLAKEKGTAGTSQTTVPDDALIHVIQPDDVDEYMDADAQDEEYRPMASTIIIVKPTDGVEATPTPAPKKQTPRVRTVTMSSGKQFVYKSKKSKEDAKADNEVEEIQDDTTEAEQFLNELREQESSKGSNSPTRKVRFEEAKKKGQNEGAGGKDARKKNGKASNPLHTKLKSLGIEGENLESGDVLITAEELKNATENFSVTVNDTEYNFDVQEHAPVPLVSTKKLDLGGPKKPKIKIPIPVQKVQCMVCGKTLLNYSYLYRHVRHFHKDIQDVDQYLDEIRPLMKVPCPLCGKEISSISNMSSHIQQCHPDTPESYKCQVCGGFYKTRISLKHHMASQHTPGRRKFPCKYCGNVFTESRSLREHVNCTHETTEVFSCEVCSKTFLTRGRLRRHMYIHGEFRLFCKYCGKGFHLKDNMNKHIDLVHEKKNQYRFKCEYCSKAFNVKGNLMQHVNGVHLKTLPYRCPICDQGFRKKGDMLIHMKAHAVKKQDPDAVDDSAEYEDVEEEAGMSAMGE